MIKLIKLLSTFFVFLLVAQNGFADDKSIQQTKIPSQTTDQQKEFAEIFQKVILSDAPLNKDLYNKFWNSIGLDTVEKRKRVVPEMRKGFMITQEYNLETLTCAALILQGKSKTTKCPKAEAKFQSIKNSSVNKEMDKNVAIIQQNNESILERAIQNPKDQSILNYVNSSKKSTEAMIKKMNRLFVVEYSDR